MILSLIFYYWHNVLEAVLSDVWTFLVTASAEGCLSACTIFFILQMAILLPWLLHQTKYKRIIENLFMKTSVTDLLGQLISPKHMPTQTLGLNKFYLMLKGTGPG